MNFPTKLYGKAADNQHIHIYWISYVYADISMTYMLITSFGKPVDKLITFMRPLLLLSFLCEDLSPHASAVYFLPIHYRVLYVVVLN